jgi:hypothetical protein
MASSYRLERIVSSVVLVPNYIWIAGLEARMRSGKFNLDMGLNKNFYPLSTHVDLRFQLRGEFCQRPQPPAVQPPRHHQKRR